MSKGWRWHVGELTAFLWRDDEIVGDVLLADTPMGKLWVWNAELDDESASGASTTRVRAIRDIRTWLQTRGVSVPEVRG